MADRFRLDEIKDLFREDVTRLLDGVREELTKLQEDPDDSHAAERLRGYGHSLKGSAALVGLTYLSQAGSTIERLSSLLSRQATTTLAPRQLVEQIQAGLPLVEALLEDALEGANPERQENLFTEFFMCFPEQVRQLLHESEDRDSSTRMHELEPRGSTVDDSGEDAAWLAELAETFNEELRENLARVPELFARLHEPEARGQAFYDLSRVFHTIKGSAAMVGQEDLSNLARYLQDTFAEAAEHGRLPAGSSDAVKTALAAIFQTAEVPAPDLPGVLPPEPAAPQPTKLAPSLPEVDPELLEAFVLDAEEALEAAERLLLQLERQPEDRGILQALFRRFHTLKGAAGAVGLDHIAEHVHQGESLLEAVLNNTLRVPTERMVDLLFRLTDAVRGFVTQARAGAPAGAEAAQQIAEEIAALSAESTPMAEQAAEPTTEAVVAASAESSPVAEAELEAGTVRIHASRLDALMSQVTQLVVSRTRMERKIETFAELRDKLDYCRRRLADLIQGFQEHYEYTIGERRGSTGVSEPTSSAEADSFFTDLEFDKYDDVNILARSVIELATDTGEIADQLGKLIESFGDESRQFNKITSALQRQITRLRMIPLDTVFRRLVRPVRTAARQAGKIVDLVLEGGDVQLDKAIVEALYAPLLHLVRNAVSHGIELPADRQARGKATAGTIRISAQPRHNSVAIEVQDDGRGIDYDAILAKGRALGLLPPHGQPSKEQLLALIFRPGFSTGEEVTDLSGRGVGMDVVARDIAALNGSLQVESREFEGTIIRLVLPISSSIDEVLILHVGEQQYALGADFVEQAVAVQRSQLLDVDGRPMLQVRNELIPVLFLGPLVEQPPPAEQATGLLLRSGDKLMALVVDHVEPQREAVLQPLGRLLEHHPFLSGATISGDGTVIFTLHVAHLFELLQAEAAHQSTFIFEARSDAIEVRPEAILVVDDSISVRKLTSRFLQSEGWEVDTAVDGLDALDKLSTGRFRLVITDLEMPRMHGYELIAEIRRQPQLRHLPIIVCSSRSSEKHRARAREVGAEGYLTKPFTKEQLIDEMVRVAGKGILPAHLAAAEQL
ncbi:MAG: Hpt domain-containing protein [Candidatus Binatia bacterium]|nr:Hpt domain-containing protein [Candidatus Binatia bacterium]